MSFRRYLTAFLTTTALLFCCSANADYTLNMTRGVTEVSNRIYNLHMTILIITAIIGVVVYGLMVWAMVWHRKSKGSVAASFHESTLVEIIWTIIPFVILLGMAAPATYTLLYMEDTSDSDLSIKITGYQWYWGYEYVDEDVSMMSRLTSSYEQKYNMAPKGENYLLEVDNHLILPIGKKIRFLMTSNDVIHSWWVPKLGVKKDAIPGFINDIWTRIDEPGIYRGQCAELCGTDHGFMPIVVEAVTQEEYDAWLQKQKSAKVAKTHNMMDM